MPSLLYGLEACPLVKSELASLDFVVNRFFTKMFGTSNMHVVRQRQSCFGSSLPSLLWSNRVDKFDFKYASCGGSFVSYGNQCQTVFNLYFFIFLSFDLSVNYVVIIYQTLLNKDVYILANLVMVYRLYKHVKICTKRLHRF